MHQTIHTSRYITVDNELVETSSKRQKTLSSFTSQKKLQTRQFLIMMRVAASYTIIPNHLTLNLKEYAHPNSDSDIPCTMSAERISGPYKQNMQTMFKFIKNNLEDMFFNAPDIRLSFAKEGISNTISFYPNQIKILSPNIKENRGLIYLFFYDKFLLGFSQII
jgi:hypothetical protein